MKILALFFIGSSSITTYTFDAVSNGLVTNLAGIELTNYTYNDQNRLQKVSTIMLKGGEILTITKTIKLIAGPIFNDNGFKYQGVEANSRWIFEREKEEVTQYIVFFKSIYHKGINAEFSLEKNPLIRFCNANDFLETNSKYWWDYSNEEELAEAITELVNISVVKGIKFLDLLSVPTIYPSYELSKELFFNHEELCHKFMQKNINIFNNYKTSSIEIVKAIDNIIISLNKDSKEENEESFLEIAATCGNMVKEVIHGDWIFDKTENKCFVKSDRERFDPLFLIYNYWNVNLRINSFLYFWDLINQPL